MKGFFDVYEQNRLHGICENGGKRPHGAVCAALLPCGLLGGYERTEPERHVYEAAGQRAVYHSGGIGIRLYPETERPGSSAADAPPQNPPEECRTVMEVKDFRYGSAGVQHLEVTAV